MSIFRRRIEVVMGPIGHVRAALEDDFHHFRVHIQHSQGRLTGIEGQAVRYPFTACPQATEPLQRLLDMPLDHIAHSVNRATEANLQCTHLLDLAGLAIAAAARGAGNRRYDIAVPRREQGRTVASLHRDGQLLLTWEVQDSRVVGPAPYAGVDLRAGMARWALSELPVEEAEAALLLRRCTLISLGREVNLDREAHALPSGKCYSQQPDIAEQALRNVGSTWDFTARKTALCADDQQWLRECEL